MRLRGRNTGLSRFVSVLSCFILNNGSSLSNPTSRSESCIDYLGFILWLSTKYWAAKYWQASKRWWEIWIFDGRMAFCIIFIPVLFCLVWERTQGQICNSRKELIVPRHGHGPERTLAHTAGRDCSMFTPSLSPVVSVTLIFLYVSRVWRQLEK